MRSPYEQFKAEPQAVVPPTYALTDDPQVFEFTPYLDIRQPIVCIARWQVIPTAGRKHHRQLTGQWRYSVEGARKLWTELKASGAQPFKGWED